MRNLIRHLMIGLLTTGSLLYGQSGEPVSNKLLEMFRFYYLPFTIEFREGRSQDEIFPFRSNQAGEFNVMVHPEELTVLNSEWDQIRETWKKKSLLLSTPVSLNEHIRITQHLTTHKVSLTRTAMDGLSIQDRIHLQDALKNKAPEIQAAVLQMRFFKSFLKDLDEERFNFFIVSPSWCESSKEYRSLFEAYMKEFPEQNLNLHSITIDDPKEEIFDSKVMREMFPNKEKYGHEIVPRFFALETVNGKTKVWEEGAALKELQARFYKARRGFMDSNTTLFKKTPPVVKSQSPRLSLNSK